MTAPTASIADRLDEARKLIERGWCQGEDARDSHGAAVSPHSADARCWCAWGAMDAVTRRGVISGMMREYFRAAVGDGVSTWNDAAERTQAEVVEAFRKAAELVRGECAL